LTLLSLRHRCGERADKVTAAVAEGQSYRWIARDLAISKNTVLEIMKRHRQSAL
jgi:DNA-binding CsgD family transcriptional regulator